MKTNYLNLLGTAFAVVLAAGCSQEELTDNPQYAVGENVLSVNVVTDGFIDSESGSRAVTEGVKITFEKGDRMGIYAVNADKVILSNVPLTYSEEGTWTTENQKIYYYENADYIAYFPYNADVKNVTSATADLTLSQTVQTAIKEAGDARLETIDQSTDFNDADLMIGVVSGVTAGAQTLNFTLEHQYSMIEFVLPTHKFKYAKAGVETTGTDDADDYVEFTVPMTDFSIKVNGKESTGFNVTADGTFRYIVKPGEVTLAEGKFLDPEDNKEVHIESPASAAVIEAGHSLRYKISVDGKSDEEAEAIDIIGKYLCADGTIWPWNTNVPTDKVVGIIYSQVGENDFAGTDMADKGFNYYALSVTERNNAGFKQVGGSFTFPEKVFKVTEDDSNKSFISIEDMSGYQSTQALIAASVGETMKSLLANWSAPSNIKTSGWFIPSAGQYWKLTDLVEGEETKTWASNRWNLANDNPVSDKIAELIPAMMESGFGTSHNYLTVTLKTDGTNIYALTLGPDRFAIGYVAIAAASSNRYIRPIIAF